MNKFEKGNWVYWNTVQMGKSGFYRIIDPEEQAGDDHYNEFRTITITNSAGRIERVYPPELYLPRLRVIFRMDGDGRPTAVFIDVNDTCSPCRKVACFRSKVGFGGIDYRGLFSNTRPLGKTESRKLKEELMRIGIEDIITLEEADYKNRIIMACAGRAAEHQLAIENNCAVSDLFENGKLREEYELDYKRYYEEKMDDLIMLAGLEKSRMELAPGHTPPPRVICSVCGSGDVQCEGTVDPNTNEARSIGDGAYYDALCSNCGWVIIYEPELVCRDIDTLYDRIGDPKGKTLYAVCEYAKTNLTDDDKNETDTMVIRLTAPAEYESGLGVEDYSCDGIEGLKRLTRHDPRRDFVIIGCNKIYTETKY